MSINFDEKPSETSPYTTFFYSNAADRAEAEVFDVNAASEINGLMFRLPSKLVQRKITGRVNGTNGAPSAGAFVYLRDRIRRFEFRLRQLKPIETAILGLTALKTESITSRRSCLPRRRPMICQSPNRSPSPKPTASL